jgi:hypothetical protein
MKQKAGNTKEMTKMMPIFNNYHRFVLQNTIAVIVDTVCSSKKKRYRNGTHWYSFAKLS